MGNRAYAGPHMVGRAGVVVMDRFVVLWVVCWIVVHPIAMFLAVPTGLYLDGCGNGAG